MKINFENLIKNSGENLTIPQLAKEMTDEGLFKNKKSAYDMIHYHINGKAKSVDLLLLYFLIRRFNKTAQEIIDFEN